MTVDLTPREIAVKFRVFIHGVKQPPESEIAQAFVENFVRLMIAKRNG